NSAMNEDNGFAGTCSPGKSERSVVSALCPAALFRVEEDSPRFEVSAFGHALELVFVLDFGEAQLRGRGAQAGDESIVLALLRSSPEGGFIGGLFAASRHRNRMNTGDRVVSRDVVVFGTEQLLRHIGITCA